MFTIANLCGIIHKKQGNPTRHAHTHPWLSWIAHQIPILTVGGSSPPGFTTKNPLYFIAVLSSSPSGLEYRMLTASKERGKRAAFAEIVRSGHSKQNQHAVFVHSTVVRKHLFVSRRRDWCYAQQSLLRSLARYKSAFGAPLRSLPSRQRPFFTSKRILTFR